MGNGVSVERVEGVWVGLAVVRDTVLSVTVGNGSLGGSVMTGVAVSVGGGDEGVAATGWVVAVASTGGVGDALPLPPHAGSRTPTSIKNITAAILVFTSVFSLSDNAEPRLPRAAFSPDLCIIVAGSRFVNQVELPCLSLCGSGKRILTLDNATRK